MTDTTSECNSQFNLAHFLKTLTLQPMVHGKRAPPMPPPKGRSARTPLVMRPGGLRKLEEIKLLDCLENETTFFFNNLNATVGDGEAFRSLKLTSQVPSKDVEKMFLYNPYEVEANSSVLFVIERGPMKSVQQLVQIIEPELHDLGFFTPARSGTLNTQKIDPAYFGAMDDSGGVESVKCILIALPPWDFAPQDFEDFTTMDTFDGGRQSFNGLHNNPPWCNADRMWAYLHDLCFMHDCHHFVLTTYEQWAFGTFSTYYSTGFVSPAISWDARPNSVLELFTYWILNACRMEGTMMVEQVPREKHIDFDVFEHERDLYRERFSSDEDMGAGPNIITYQTRPLKRARKDPLEDRMGWEPLDQHADVLYPSTPKLRSSKTITMGVNRGLGSDVEDDDDVLAKPCPIWNTWYTKERDQENKENPPSHVGELAQNDKSLEQTPKIATPPHLGYPIPRYSLDVDRNNNCFRPGLIDLVSFPLPAS